LTSHPDGCAQKKIKWNVQSKGAIAGGFVIGASTGFGLASRISSAFGSDAATIGVFQPTEGRTASPGWYNLLLLKKKQKQDLCKSVNGDVFSDEVKKQTLDLISRLRSVDLII
jgi:enoyl-[acyl-carrier protein] reductase/trans-2-enoyl-CoA reductase (NAD+)